MEDFKMNRAVVNKSTFAEADDHVSFYSDKTPLERLNAACGIINAIYNSSPSQKIERTITSSRKHKK
ncbi:MAG: hypothetical protein ACK4RM_07580 [Flavobacterium sp.]